VRIRSCHHLRSDAVDALRERLEERFGESVDGDAFERVETDGRDVVLVDGEPHVYYVDEEPALTVRGANAHPPTRRVVTVDEGAVAFVSDGADVMRPGIVDADDAIAAGDFVVVDEAAHGKVLAVGRARTAGDDMRGESGKVVDTLHHVGDDLYGFAP
jgi:PUA domain protein